MSKAEMRLSSETAGAASRELYLGDAIHFFLSAKHAGGRSERTIDDYRKKLELFQRWLAVRVGGEDAVDASYIDIGADEIEAYVVHLRDERGMSDSSRKNHLAVLRSFFQTVSKRMRLHESALLSVCLSGCCLWLLSLYRRKYKLRPIALRI